MIARKIATGLLSAFLLGTALTNGGAAEAATRSNLDRDDVIYNNIEYYQPDTADTYQAPPIKVGYIITGDDDTVLDEQTMGYIRRVLNAKFPGDRYPAKRLTDDNSVFQRGRLNYGDRYELTEAHDMLMKEYEKLEELYEARRDIALSNSDQVNALEVDPLLNTNNYSFRSHLGMLPKENYVRFARELQASGSSDYDYLLLYNIQCRGQQYKEKYASTVILNDYKISVRAININTGEYIDRGEYVARGTAGSYNGRFTLGLFSSSPSKRGSMREAVLNGMIESFDHMPIGKYSICDSQYCLRRQKELRTEKAFGKISRHCVKHCNDSTDCYDHIVDYEKDADLPYAYLKGGIEKID